MRGARGFSIGTGVGKVFRSIAERKRVEERLQRSERLFKLFVDYAPAAIAMFDRGMRYLAASRRYLADYEIAGQDVIGRSHYEIFPELPERWKEFHRRGLAGETVSAAEDSFLRANGKTVWVRWEIHPWYERPGEIGGIILFSEVITERKEMDQLLRDVQRREAVGVLSSGIAHDFNNLLAVMMGNVSLAQMQLTPQHPAYKNMEQTLTAIESAAELTNQILAYSGKGKYEIRTVDLAAEIRTHVGLFSVSMPKNVRLVTHMPPEPVYVNGDPGQLKQVIMNLIINGGDAIGEQQGTVTVSLSSAGLGVEELAPYSRITSAPLNEGRYARLDVSDTGIGMSAETMNRIFDPFFTTKFTGRGLGLSAVLGIIRSHEGGIMLESEEGKGSTFRIVLPLSREQAAGHGERMEEQRPASDTAAMTVMVIDDEVEVAEMARDILQTAQYTVIAETSPVRAIEEFKRSWKEIGAVLLDMTMPEMSGKDVVDALRAVDPDVRIVVSSGYSEYEVQKRIGTGKISGFLQKPYPLQTLLSKMQSVAKRR